MEKINAAAQRNIFVFMARDYTGEPLENMKRLKNAGERKEKGRPGGGSPM